MDSSERNVYYTWQDFDKDIKSSIEFLDMHKSEIEAVYAINDNSLIPAVVFSKYLDVPLILRSESVLKIKLLFNLSCEKSP